MSDVTRILSQIEQGDPQAAVKLLPLAYDELRKLAAAKLAQEKPGQTLQVTALAHEASMRLVGGKGQSWDNRGRFFAAAAEAMRRILVEIARRKMQARYTNVNIGGWIGPASYSLVPAAWHRNGRGLFPEIQSYSDTRRACIQSKARGG
jgi:RNA polymerase sigma factor (TIGR02999 family)